jgi:hypothetical protein
VPDHPNYEASSLGRVRSVDRTFIDSIGRQYSLPGVVLRPTRQGRYLKVALGADNTIAVHIVVCSAFHGPRPAGKHGVAHGNGDCHDNRPSNLRWATVSENLADMVHHGTSCVGSKNGASKLTEADIRAIRKLRAANMPVKDIAARYGTHYVHISRIVHRVIWQHVP